MCLLNVLLPSKIHLSTSTTETKGLGLQKHRSALSAYPHTAQELLIISRGWNTFTWPDSTRRSPPYSVVNPFPDLLDHTCLGVCDKEEGTGYRPLRESYRERAYDASTKSTMVFPVRYRVKGGPKWNLVTRATIMDRSLTNKAGTVTQKSPLPMV